jgi:hypothetical protein
MPYHWRRCAERDIDPRNRYVVFQCLPHTLGLPTATWRVLATAHGLRNQAEYEGLLNIDERLVGDLLTAARAVLAALRSGGQAHDR